MMNTNTDGSGSFMSGHVNVEIMKRGQTKKGIGINKFEKQLRDIQRYKFKNQVGFISKNESFLQNINGRSTEALNQYKMSKILELNSREGLTPNMNFLKLREL